MHARLEITKYKDGRFGAGWVSTDARDYCGTCWPAKKAELVGVVRPIKDV